MKDLLRSDMDVLKEYLLRRRYHSTSEIITFTVNNYSTRGNRNKQILVNQGFLRKLTEDESMNLFGNTNQGYYETSDLKA